MLSHMDTVVSAVFVEKTGVFFFPLNDLHNITKEVQDLCTENDKISI